MLASTFYCILGTPSEAKSKKVKIIVLESYMAKHYPFTAVILGNGYTLFDNIFWKNYSKLDTTYGQFQFRQMKLYKEYLDQKQVF